MLFIVKAVLLAAGKGTRIYPFSQEKPKPLIEVANKAVLEHNLDQMLGLVDEAIIVVGYKKDQIMEKLGDQYNSMKITYVVQEEMLGTGHALMQAEGKVTGKFFVLNGDDLFSRRDMENLAKYDNSILLKHKEDVSNFGVVVVENGKAVDVIEKPQGIPPSHFVNVGMYCFSEGVFSILKTLPKSPRGEYEITDAVKALAQEGKMHYAEVEGFWIPVGYPWQILDANKILLGDEHGSVIKGKVEEGVTIDGCVHIQEGAVVKSGTLLKGHIVIGKNTVVGENCMVTGYTAIGDGCIIDDSCGIENSIVGAETKLGKRCAVKDSVLGEHVELSAGVRIENMGKNGTVKIHGEKKVFDSGKVKLGAFVADNVELDESLEPGDCVTKE